MNAALFRRILTPNDETPAHRNFLRRLGFRVKGDGHANADYMTSRVTVPDDAGWTQSEKGEDNTTLFFNARGHNRFDLARLDKGYELQPKTRFEIKKDSGNEGDEADQTYFIIDNAAGSGIVQAFGSEEEAAEWLVDKGFPEYEDFTLYWDAVAPTADTPETEDDGLDADGEPRAQ